MKQYMVDWTSVNKVLVIRFLGIGDVLFTTPMLRTLKKSHPHLRITYLTSPYSSPVIRGNPNVDEVLTCDMLSLKELLLSPLRFVRMILSLRRKKFDVTIITHRSFQAILFARLIGSPIRIGYDYERQGSLLTERILLNENKYAPQHYMDLLGELGASETNLQPEVSLSAEDHAFVEKVLSNTNGEVIAIGPGGGVNAGMNLFRKRWTVEGFAEVIGSLADKYEIMLVGGPEDMGPSQAVKEKTSAAITDLTGKSTICQAAALLQRCKLFIGNDSMLLHLAAAVGTPTVSVYGPTNPAFFAPQGKGHLVVKSEVPCSPCFTYGKPPECEDNICMKSIDANDVLSAAANLLDQ